MGRPRLNDRDRRVHQLNMSLTDDEYARLTTYAQTSGVSVVKIIRSKVFSGKFPVAKVSKLDEAAYNELKRIGVNLNQAVHKINIGESPKDYLALLTHLLGLLNKILKLLLHDRKSDQG